MHQHVDRLVSRVQIKFVLGACMLLGVAVLTATLSSRTTFWTSGTLPAGSSAPAALQATLPVQGSRLRVALAVSPAALGRTVLMVTVLRLTAQGRWQPEGDGQVHIKMVMPAMAHMGTVIAMTTMIGAGRYQARATVTMSGDWRLDVLVRTPRDPLIYHDAVFRLTLGLSGEPPALQPWDTTGAGSAPPSPNAPIAAQWRQVGLPLVLVHALTLGHTDPTLAFAATSRGIYRREHNRTWGHVLTTGDVWSIDLLPDDKTVLAADNDGDVDISDDAGLHWRRVNVNRQGAFAVTVQPGHGQRILIGAVDGIYLSDDGSLRWTHRLRLTTNSAIAAFAWQPGTSRIVFAGAVAGSPDGSTSVFVSHDGGMTWQVFGHGLESEAGLMSLTVLPSRTVFAGTMGNAVWTASGAQPTWHKNARGMPPTNDHVASLITIPGQPGTVVAGTEGHGVFRTTDSGRQWTNISDGLSAARDATVVLGVTYAPLEHALYAATADGVYEWKGR